MASSNTLETRERETPYCECLTQVVTHEDGTQERTSCWQRIPGDAHELGRIWDRAHAPLPSAPEVRNYFVRLVIAGHEQDFPILESGEGWSIVDSPGQEA